MNFKDALNMGKKPMLMEGALGERLKAEYGINPDESLLWSALIYSDEGRRALRELWSEYACIAKKSGLSFMATTPTRRANKQRVFESGFDEKIIYDNMRFLNSIKEGIGTQMFAGALMGCKGDAYTGEGCLNRKDSKEFHKWTIDHFKRSGADFIFAAIMPTIPEAIGMSEALSEAEIEYIISFTINRNGTLIDKTSIDDAILEIDSAVKNKPVCFMANCVHPQILREALLKPCNQTLNVQKRFLGIQANTSPLEYHELENAKDFKNTPPKEFSKMMISLKNDFDFKILGGCCGTNKQYLQMIADAL